jgi:hypothetical protein
MRDLIVRDGDSVTLNVMNQAAGLAATHGPDTEEALRRWEVEGGVIGAENASTWLSVAFLFARFDRSQRAQLPDTAAA